MIEAIMGPKGAVSPAFHTSLVARSDPALYTVNNAGKKSHKLGGLAAVTFHLSLPAATLIDK